MAPNEWGEQRMGEPMAPNVEDNEPEFTTVVLELLLSSDFSCP